MRYKMYLTGIMVILVAPSIAKLSRVLKCNTPKKDNVWFRVRFVEKKTYSTLCKSASVERVFTSSARQDDT